MMPNTMWTTRNAIEWSCTTMNTERTAGRMTTERTARSPLRGLIGFNLLTGILLGIVGFYFGSRS